MYRIETMERVHGCLFETGPGSCSRKSTQVAQSTSNGIPFACTCSKRWETKKFLPPQINRSVQLQKIRTTSPSRPRAMAVPHQVKAIFLLQLDRKSTRLNSSH